MRNILLFLAAILLAPTTAVAQSPPAKDLKGLFDAVQKLGNDTELRGDISDRLGFGEDPLPIKDLVIKTNGVQHAVNAFVVSNRAYILFDSHLYAPEIYIFVRSVDGTLVAGFHGQQYQPVTNTIDMTPRDDSPVVGAEGFLVSVARGRRKAAPADKLTAVTRSFERVDALRLMR